MPLPIKTKPRLGIISGAGPMAGISLLRQTIQLFQLNGAWKDADYPEIHLINFPFSEMLSKQFDQEKVCAELLQCIRTLQYCEHIVIACNTLHLFLPKSPIPCLINLINLIKSRIPKGSKPLVVASLTSASENLHGRLLGMDCDYWEPQKSQKLIDAILQGKQVKLNWLLGLAKTRPVILGCTEYSLALEHLPYIQGLIDPIKLAAQTLFELYNNCLSS